MHNDTDTGRQPITQEWQLVMDAIRNGVIDPFQTLRATKVEVAEPDSKLVEELESYAYAR
jgi:hypothetical protein